MNRFARPFWVILALLFLFEAWLWDRLEPIVARIVSLIPLGWVKPALVRFVDRLSPPATLGVFIVPFVLLLPLKFLEVWFFAHRNWLGAVVVLVLAKLIGLGVTAFVFEVTKDKLLRMAWFRRVYAFFIWLRAWAHEMVEPIMRRLRAWRRLLRPARGGRFLEHLMRIRRRMRATAP